MSNTAIGVAGFLSYKNEFNLLEYLTQISDLPISNFDTLTTKILQEISIIDCADFQETSTIFLLANFQNKIHNKTSIYKNKNRADILKESLFPNHNYKFYDFKFKINDLNNCLSHSICNPYGNFDYLKINEIVDFSTNYFDENLALLVLSIFHIYATKNIGVDYYRDFKELNNIETIKFIRSFYEYIIELLPKGYHELKSIGICNQIVSVEEYEVKFLFDE